MGHNGEALFSATYYSCELSVEISHLAYGVFIKYSDVLRTITEIH